MNPNMPSSGRVDVSDTIRTLATIVRLHEGNRDEQVNALLQRSEECAAYVSELIAKTSQLANAVTFRIDDDRSVMLDELRAALAALTEPQS